VSASSREARLAELMTALSLATDLGMGQPLEQALRYCLLALELGRRIGCDARALSDVYYLALLEHVGCTATAAEMAAWNGGDELAFRSRAIVLTHASTGEFVRHLARHLGEGLPRARRARLLAAGLAAGGRRFERLVALQCEGAARLADRLGMTEGVREGLGHYYERWDGKGAPGGLAGDQISLAQRVVIVAHDAVTVARVSGVPSALELIGRRRGGAYDPTVCDALLADAESLLRADDEDAGDAWTRVQEAEPEPQRVVREAELDDVARAFADFADLKAPFLVGHSQAVAELAAAGAGSLGLSREGAIAVRRAGLLHDLGRLGVPNGVWEKPGTLTSSERERVRLHPYYTERILARTATLAPLAVCAACHHERLDGSGYHRGVGASQLAPEARLLAAADVYDAMTHDRPHRSALDPSRARAELRAEVEHGRLDQRAVNAVLEAAGARPVRVREAWPAGLSDREVEVLRLLARGKTNRQIAADLVIAEKTVGRHVENIYAKAGIGTRAGAALFASEHELLG
jgi:HD-GYP domain-containing protein (c-di-GMP phosphodiesterase class II)